MKKKAFFIGGPCSAESEQQLLDVAHGLQDANIQLFRAGLWKPRTRPDAFEGVGVLGIPWMQRVKETYQLPICTEVAHAHHVEHILKADFDAVWIGARTTSNPFSVQEIASALKGVDIPVFIKNPINPDINLWIGAYERIFKAGVQDIRLIHRGFSVFRDPVYRNSPNWQIPIEMKGHFPELDMLCDHSHICGRRDILEAVAQTAFNLNFDGLMTEVHCYPDDAWSDAQQQITPEVYKAMRSRLHYKNLKSDDPSFVKKINQLRVEIDALDDTLIDVLARRMGIARQIGRDKQIENVSILQLERWQDMLERILAQGKEKGLSDDFIFSMFRAIHQESIDQQDIELRKQIASATQQNFIEK